MAGTAVENIPGGLLDRILSDAGDPGTVLHRTRCAAAGGAYVTALGTVDALPHHADPRIAAWRRFAWHGVWLALPDGASRPMTDLAGRFAEEPWRPAVLRGDDPEAWLVGRLLPDLRSWRTVLSPQTAATCPEMIEPSYRSAMAELERSRHHARTPALHGHLDLLAADVAARVGDGATAQRYWNRAWRRLTDGGDDRGLAAAMVVRGDLFATPLASPLSWNCVLYRAENAAAGELAAQVEGLQFTGSPPPDPAAVVAAYDAAASRYAALDDRAGLATVDLRRGYLALLAGRPDEALDLARGAAAAFERAGRPVDAAIAATHEVLAAIADDRFPEGGRLVNHLSAARPVVGHATVLGLALLCLRVGRHWAGHEDPERAVAALGLAERLWDRLGERTARAQTLLAGGLAAASSGDVPAARAFLLRSLDADPGPLAEPAEPRDARRQRRAVTAHHGYTLCQREDDVDGMADAVSVLRETVEPLRERLDGLGQPDR